MIGALTQQAKPIMVIIIATSITRQQKSRYLLQLPIATQHHQVRKNLSHLRSTALELEHFTPNNTSKCQDIHLLPKLKYK